MLTTRFGAGSWQASRDASICETRLWETVQPEMCSERDSPLEPFVLPAPGQPELARLTCGAHLGPPVLTRKQKRPRVNSLVCDRAAAFCAAGPPEVLSRMSRPVTQAAKRKRKRELTRARSQRLQQAAWSLTGEPVSRGFAGRGALEGYLSHYTSLVQHSISQPPMHLCFARAIVLIAHPKITQILSFSWGFSSKVAIWTP